MSSRPFPVSRSEILKSLAWLLIVTFFLTVGIPAQQLDSVFPPRQRVHEMITLRGSGFANFTPGTSRVRFTSGAVTVEAGTPYVWRPDFIQVRVPVGDLVSNVVTPIPTGLLSVTVVTAAGTSNVRTFQVIQGATVPSFTEKTDVQPVGVGRWQDFSIFLGDPNNANDMRTKDAAPSDIDADGYPDLIDNNSNNETNVSNPIAHLNNRSGSFIAVNLEPRNSVDLQQTLTTVPPNGDFIKDATVYDEDFVDLNNDGWLDAVQGASRNGPNRLRILINGAGGLVSRFTEASSSWVPNNSFNGCPDDIAHWDVDNDGFVDVAAAMRTVFSVCRSFGSTTGEVRLWRNNGSSLGAALVFPSPLGVSAHDVFFLDFDDDGWTDFLLVNENGASQIFRNNGAGNNFTAQVPTFPSALSGLSGDFNADGLADFVFVGSNIASVFLNSAASPGSFTSSNLSGGLVGPLYDVELGDVDLDGSVDIVAANITQTAGNTVRIWLNNGAGGFTNFTTPDATAVLPNIAPIQRLSADLLDFDLDGDLDLYITGADGQNASPGGGFGRAPNQFYQNDIDPVLPPLPQTDAWMRDTPTDNGTVPTPGSVMWQSPDIWNRLSPDCAPTPGKPNCNNNHQNPEFGQTNYFYGKIRNRGTETMHHGLVEFWIASASVGLAWPTDFTKIGELAVISLLPNEVRNIGPLLWNPPNPAPSDHFCVYVRIITDQDPLSPPETSSVFHNTKHENGIVWRNLKIEDNMSGTSSFIVRNLEEGAGTSIDLTFETVQGLLNVATILVEVDPTGPNPFLRWNGQGNGFVQIDQLTFQITAPDAAMLGIPLLADEEFGMTVRTQAPQNAVNTPRELVVTEVVDGEPVGGVNLRVGVKRTVRCKRGTPVINEFDVASSALANKQFVQFLEFQAIGCIGVDLAAFKVQLSEFVSGRETVYATIKLPDITLPPDRFFVVCSKKASAKECDLVLDGDFLNKTRKSAISVLLDGKVIDRAEYNQGEMLDDAQAGFVSLSRYPDGVDVTSKAFSRKCITPGGPNSANGEGCKSPQPEEKK